MTPSRFRPHRLGIVGLYEYADQTFHVEDGRLALRGRNTSGKSKALELLIPYVLDGDITPRKLDPFASSLKTMRWNLIECTDPYPERRATKRIGYVWAEFRAVEDGGEERFFTCGLGLEATRSADGIKDRWYFTTTQRVGVELTLARLVGGADDSHAGALAAQPVVKADLAGQLGHDGALHDGPTAYKEALRDRLLPFATSRPVRADARSDPAAPQAKAVGHPQRQGPLDDALRRPAGCRRGARAQARRRARAAPRASTPVRRAQSGAHRGGGTRQRRGARIRPRTARGPRRAAAGKQHRVRASAHRPARGGGGPRRRCRRPAGRRGRSQAVACPLPPRRRRASGARRL